MLKLDNLSYDSYSTGRYGPEKSEGITLQFIDNISGNVYYLVWNVHLKRQRATKSRSKGSPYPSKRFSVTRRMKFYRFWHYTCGLSIPSRGLTSFHDCMGKLKDIRFEAMILEGEKLNKDTLKPSVAENLQTTNRQVPNTSPTISPDKHLEKTKTMSDFKEILTTCKSNYGKSNQGKTDTRLPTHASCAPWGDTSDWLSDCDELF